jgi:hypothetical protein
MVERQWQVGEVLARLWGNGMPSGDAPFVLVAEDALAIDDAAGRVDGVIVRSDRIRLADVEHVLRDGAPSPARDRLRSSLGLKLDEPTENAGSQQV